MAMKTLPPCAKIPHLLALEKTTGRPLDAARVEPAHEMQYWLYNPWRQIRVRVDLGPILNAHHPFTHLGIRFIPTGEERPSDAFWHWQRSFPQHTQPLRLKRIPGRTGLASAGLFTPCCLSAGDSDCAGKRGALAA